MDFKQLFNVCIVCRRQSFGAVQKEAAGILCAAWWLGAEEAFGTRLTKGYVEVICRRSQSRLHIGKGPSNCAAVYAWSENSRSTICTLELGVGDGARLLLYREFLVAKA